MLLLTPQLEWSLPSFGCLVHILYCYAGTLATSLSFGSARAKTRVQIPHSPSEPPNKQFVHYVKCGFLMLSRNPPTTRSSFWQNKLFTSLPCSHEQFQFGKHQLYSDLKYLSRNIPLFLLRYFLDGYLAF